MQAFPRLRGGSQLPSDNFDVKASFLPHACSYDCVYAVSAKVHFPLWFVSRFLAIYKHFYEQGFNVCSCLLTLLHVTTDYQLAQLYALLPFFCALFVYGLMQLLHCLDTLAHFVFRTLQ